ncbi:Helix-turn-helix domain-containing protein [Tessaracoccus oleiagri]|uniref:Helix-turn-helix domain-containing protein n=1 Tax=Tessaracoccus oleiagri TaxID=686624 RepID=A0A1G9N9H0_9ACTN|nr:Helix-turn-helix domain-containing protein [Tessaracoccus oleiagri]
MQITDVASRGLGPTAVAHGLGRAPSTISRMLRRNSSRTGQYRPFGAPAAAAARRRRLWPCKLAVGPDLRNRALSPLRPTWLRSRRPNPGRTERATSSSDTSPPRNRHPHRAATPQPQAPLPAAPEHARDARRPRPKVRYSRNHCRTLTWAKGTEMARHHDVTENTNGRLRQHLPKSTDLSLHSPSDLAHVESELNTTPHPPRQVSAFGAPSTPMALAVKAPPGWYASALEPPREKAITAQKPNRPLRRSAGA